MKTVQYIGGASQRILTDDDMTKLGHEEHKGLWFGPPPEDDPFAALTAEVDDDVADTLCQTMRYEFKVLETEEPAPKAKGKKKKASEGEPDGEGASSDDPDS